ncbi:uncharacterized protein C10orf67 homolog, mitochondrial [Sarcoramphus papa]
MSAAPAGAAGPRPWALRLAPQTLELLALPCCLEEPEPERRPCISDDLKIGYYSTDHAMQTDIKEIPELKELAIATQALIKLVHSLQQDLFTYKSIIQAQYEEKIEEQASNLCKYINDQLTDIEFLHKWKEVQIRQSCQQQLCDALAVLRANIEKYYNINGEDTAFSPGKLLRLLRNKLHEEESITEDLERKKRKDCIAIFQIVFEDDDHEKKMLEKENEDFKEEVFKRHNEISHLENALKRSEKEKYLLDKQVQRMRSKMEADEQTAQQMNLSAMTKFPTLKVVIPTDLYRSIERLIEIQEQVKAELENERPLVKNLITYVVPEQQAAERTLTAETEKLKKHKGQERQTTESTVQSHLGIFSENDCSWRVNEHRLFGGKETPVNFSPRPAPFRVPPPAAVPGRCPPPAPRRRSAPWTRSAPAAASAPGPGRHCRLGGTRWPRGGSGFSPGSPGLVLLPFPCGRPLSASAWRLRRETPCRPLECAARERALAPAGVVLPEGRTTSREGCPSS